MTYTPMPHQVEDSDRLLEYQHGYLWADPGTGKTLTSMEAFRKGGYDKLVVLAPKIALTMWAEELHSHLGLKYGVLRKGHVTKGFWGLGVDTVITTHDLAGKHYDLLAKFGARGSTALVLDEAHYYKSPDAKRTQAVMGPGLRGVGGVFGLFDSVWQLTGTPVTRYVDDLYSQLAPGRMDILKHYGVGSYPAFVNEFCTTKLVQYSKYGAKRMVVSGNKNLDKLKGLTAACYPIRRTLMEVIDDMPEVSYRVVEVETRGVGRLEKMSDEALLAALNDPDSGVAKLRSALALAKVGGIMEYVKEYGNKPVLIGMWHRDAIEELRSALGAHGSVAAVHGGTPDGEREQIRRAFNGGSLDYLIGQTRAMRESWNLQQLSCHVVMGEEEPSPAAVSQFVARVHRAGQQNHVQVDFIHSTHELDTALMRIRMSKQTDVERVIT